MAIRTKMAVSFDDGRCVWSYDYDDVLLRLTRVRCTNASAAPTRGTLTVLANGRTFTALVAPGGTLDQNVPTGTTTRLSITVDARGRVDGLDHRFAWGPNVV